MVMNKESGEALSPAIRAILANTGKPRMLLRDEPLRNIIRDGVRGYQFAVDLPSYRSLPLSCIDDIELKVDGIAVPRERIRLALNGTCHTLEQLGDMSHVFWFVLDPAHIFVANDVELTGSHSFELDIVTVEPYVTAGRYSFHHPVKRLLTSTSDGQTERGPGQ